MKFGPWVPLSEAAARLPPAAGVLQVRLREGLVRYPRGKSAMVVYAGAADVAGLAAELNERHPAAPWLCRTSVGPCPDPSAAAARLRAEFDERFGSCPKVPVSEDMIQR
ncbi:hypothetical protein [Nannocystis bainbridge]|uniref:Uncharacterized protein n=1 Tax=Nannocystis bainbridge TaxID=2995303 RepID=A0ABT5DYX0_9BACT|nr:hypothetical protein [Nannocystis bainbridge]MDC0717948.1 hypothetical protein [Nannocystis bainbridge]